MFAKGWICDKPCLVTIAWPDITADCPRETYPRGTASGGIREDPPYLEGSLRKTSLEQRPETTWC
jgi:hypothetical protein